MNKERLVAFTDAVLAIIMTILVLELEKPAEATWAAVLEIRENFFAYMLTFFWLGTMWINIHEEWNGIKNINRRVVWINIILLFFSSLFPYVTKFVSMNFSSSVAQVLYGIIVLSVTITNIFANRALELANAPYKEIQYNIAKRRRKLYIDVFIKIIGIIIALTIYPPAMMLSVLITLLFVILVPIRNKLKYKDNSENVNQ